MGIGLALEVKDAWRVSGLRGRDISDDELDALERRVGTLPPDYRDFLAIAGTQRDTDDEGILFWAPEAVRPARAVLAAAGYRMTSCHEALVIADYFQESWWYVLWTSGPDAGAVSVALDGEAADPRIGSFEEFLEAYLARSDLLSRPR